MDLTDCTSGSHPTFQCQLEIFLQKLLDLWTASRLYSGANFVLYLRYILETSFLDLTFLFMVMLMIL